MAKGKYQEWLEPEGLLKIEGWARDGLTDEQIAQNMGVAYSTFRTWRDKYSALSAVLKRIRMLLIGKWKIHCSKERSGALVK